MKFRIYVFSSSTKEIPCYMRESNMQGCLEFPSLIDLTFYLLDLNKEVSLSLGIMVYDSQRKMLTNVILLRILYMVCIKNKYSNNFNDERKKDKLHPLLFIIKR